MQNLTKFPGNKEAVEAKYEIDQTQQQKENQIQIQQLEIEQNKRERVAFILALLALISIVVLGYRLYRQRQKANRLLSEKNAQIQKSKILLLLRFH